jgi:hypothetical protein
MLAPRDLSTTELLHATRAEALHLEGNWAVRTHRRRRHLETVAQRLVAAQRWNDSQAARLSRARDRLALALRVGRDRRWYASLAVLRLGWWSVLAVFWVAGWGDGHEHLLRAMVPVMALGVGLVERCGRG